MAIYLGLEFVIRKRVSAVRRYYIHIMAGLHFGYILSRQLKKITILTLTGLRMEMRCKLHFPVLYSVRKYGNEHEYLLWKSNSRKIRLPILH